jgi:periplasmic protein TonB
VKGALPDMRPPVPLRKVDPKYVAAAAADRVEGKVRLAAVIRRTGHVDSVAVLQGLDARLDASAEEAMSKWEFEPAVRNGVAVDVDAVVEIPFRLAPRAAK